MFKSSQPHLLFWPQWCKASCLIILLSLSFPVLSQHYTDAMLNTTMDAGISAMKIGEFKKADSLFRVTLEHKKVLPSDLTYYFGKNSYHIGRYKQGINWLTKYVQLKGSTGRHFTDASLYITKCEEAYLRTLNQSVSPNDSSYINAITSFTLNVDVECPSDTIICPVCNGNGAIVVHGKYDKIYKTCPYSGLKGFMSCDEYNLFMNGNLPKKD